VPRGLSIGNPHGCGRPREGPPPGAAGNNVIHLVTGGSGVLGRGVCRDLIEHGFEVRVFDPRPPPHDLAGRLEHICGSVLDRDALAAAAKGCEVVHHLAASMPQAALSARKFWELNVGGTMNAAEAALRAGARRLVFASTIEIYGLHHPHEFPVTEDSEKRFTGVYSRNKWECEGRLMGYRDRGRLEVVFPRMPMIFGPGFYHEPSMMLLFRLIERGWPVPVLARPEAPWASVSSADAGTAFRLCAEVGEADGEALNIAAADAPACVDALSELIRRTGSRSRLVKVPARWTERAVDLIERLGDSSPTPAELARFALVGGVYSIDKARRILAYEPRYSAVDGMEAALRYVCSL